LLEWLHLQAEIHQIDMLHGGLVGGCARYEMKLLKDLSWLPTSLVEKRDCESISKNEKKRERD
jgi:hypothetical protein